VPGRLRRVIDHGAIVVVASAFGRGLSVELGHVPYQAMIVVSDQPVHATANQCSAPDTALRGSVVGRRATPSCRWASVKAPTTQPCGVRRRRVTTQSVPEGSTMRAASASGGASSPRVVCRGDGRNGVDEILLIIITGLSRVRPGCRRLVRQSRVGNQFLPKG
jgi:hypothetical protein